MAAGKVQASQQIGMNGGKHWRWTGQDIEKIRNYKQAHFREGQGRRNRKKVRKTK
jgi:hypothetical protein